ncbi:hypothetical protein [Streptomyces nanshensis]|uniref:hypothetical protein n=1 Tax=Streptomyces nanshensis TaxID=518642 RepID=UPI00099F4509|nr:hypothetical protein [Streptomyces nanshensis]
MTPWYEGPLAALAVRAAAPPPAGRGTQDVSGPDPESDRLGDAAVAVQHTPRSPVETHVPRAVPDTAEGRSAADIARTLASYAAGTPLVVLDAPYVLTLLDRELRRHRHTPLPACLGVRTLCVLDPVLLDRRLDRTAAAGGSRRGTAQLCAAYGVSAPRDGTVQEEAVAALALARALGRRFAPRLTGLTPAALHTLQAIWFAAERDAPVPWFSRGTRRSADHIWPLRPPSAA